VAAQRRAWNVPSRTGLVSAGEVEARLAGGAAWVGDGVAARHAEPGCAPQDWEHAMSDHVGLSVSDYEASKAFYLAALAPLATGW
jgi:hypothetical protein